jgi:hypothetical protein
MRMSTGIVVVVKWLVSSSPFKLAYTFQSGIIVCLIVTIGMYLMNQLSFAVYIRTWTTGADNSYTGIWRNAIGPRTSWIASVITIMALLLLTQGKMSELSGSIPAAIYTIYPAAPAFLSNPWFLQSLFVVLFIIPCACSARYRWWVWIGWTALACLITGFLLLVSYFFRIQISSFDPATHIIWSSSDYRLLIGVVNDFCIAFYLHQIVAPVVEESEDTSWTGIMKMTWIAGAICWGCSFGIPFLCYMCNPAMPSGIIFQSLDINAPEVICGNVIVVIVGLLSDAFFTFITAKEIAEFVAPDASRSTFVLSLSSLIISLSSMMLNRLPGISGRIIGEIFYQSFVSLAYILPPLYYFATYGFHLGWVWAALFVFAVGLFICSWSLSAFVQDMIAVE